jgi:hypothetical protein
MSKQGCRGMPESTIQYHTLKDWPEQAIYQYMTDKANRNHPETGFGLGVLSDKVEGWTLKLKDFMLVESIMHRSEACHQQALETSFLPCHCVLSYYLPGQLKQNPSAERSCTTWYMTKQQIAARKKTRVLA